MQPNLTRLITILVVLGIIIGGGAIFVKFILTYSGSIWLATSPSTSKYY